MNNDTIFWASVFILSIMVLMMLRKNKKQEINEDFYYTYPYYSGNCVTDVFGTTKCYNYPPYPAYRRPRYPLFPRRHVRYSRFL